MALATHVTSWCMTRLRSAVTSPPPPRRATRSPCASRANVTGPRFDATISRLRSAIGWSLSPPRRVLRRGDRGNLDTLRVEAEQTIEEDEPVAEQPRRQEVPAHVLLAAQRTLPRRLRLSQDLDARGRARLRRVDEPAGLAVDDLHPNPADVAGDSRPSLPQPFAHGQPEAFANRLLDDGAGVHLERVHLDRADVVQVR